MTRFCSRALFGVGLLSVFSSSTLPSALAAENPSSKDPASKATAKRSLTLDGTTGTLRVSSADSNPKGTVALALTQSLYAGSGFLCPNCTTTNGDVSSSDDDSMVSSSRLQLSLSPTSFLEGFASVAFQSTSNDQNDPQMLQMAGNTVLGLKGFVPHREGRPWNLAAIGSLNLMARSERVGGVSVNGDLGVAMTLDTKDASFAKSVPLRLHLNAVYRIDNGGEAADEIESRRSESRGTPQRITRFERLGYAIRRTDIARPAIALEGSFSRYRPFVEWSIDLPINRQDHQCKLGAVSAGDSCLSRSHEFSAIPSRLTMGLAAYPFRRPLLEGLGFLAAFDIGTGGTSNFIEEAIPELPYQVHLGISYALDPAHAALPVVSPAPRKEPVQAVAAPEPKAISVIGRVVEVTGDGKPEAGVPGAQVFFEGAETSGLITDQEGRFHALQKAAGNYRLRIVKEGYLDGTCDLTVSADQSPTASAPPATAPATTTPTATAPVSATETGRTTPATCSLARLPEHAVVVGGVRDARTTLYLQNARVTVTDPRGRQLALMTDEYGAFRIEKIPAGSARIYVEADGFLPSAVALDLKPRDNREVRVNLHSRPKERQVLANPRQLTLKQPIRFAHDSSEILPESLPIVEEAAEVIRAQNVPVIVEIKGHAQDTGSIDHDSALSRGRAQAVQKLLVLLGVPAERLLANGYGAEHPLAPNSTPASRAKNDRVEIGLAGQR